MKTMNRVLSAFLKASDLFLVALPTRAPLLIFCVTCPRVAPTLKKAPWCFGLSSGTPVPRLSEPHPAWHSRARAGSTTARRWSPRDRGRLLPSCLPPSVLPSSLYWCYINERAAGQLKRAGCRQGLLQGGFITHRKKQGMGMQNEVKKLIKMQHQ